MSSKDINLDTWLEQAEQYALPNWDQLSSIPLYMDQVLLFMSDVFDLFENDEASPVLTSSMINNYVKNGLVEHPDHKKYTREHLAKIVMIGMLKQVLPIQDIAVLFSESADTKEMFEAFTHAQDTALHETVEAIKNTESDPTGLHATALRLVAEANARRAVAEQLLRSLSPAQKDAEAKPKKNPKNK